MNIFELDESLRTENPCWKGYHPVGTKKKNGRTVPNCVPNANEGVEEASIPYALSAANANAEYRRQGAAGGGYRGRIDIPVQSREDYISAGRALKKAAAAAGQKIEYGLSDGIMSVFSDSMTSDELDQFIDDVLDQGVAEGSEEGNLYAMALQRYPRLKRVDREIVINALNGAYEDYLMHYGYEGIGPDEESSMIDHAVKGLKQGVAEGSLAEGQYEMMLRNGQVKKFVAKDDADAKRIAAGHGAKSVIRLRGGVPAGKVSEQGVAEGNKEADYGPEYQDMVRRVGQRAKQGPMKTVWDPIKRVYKNVPVKDKSVKETGDSISLTMNNGSTRIVRSGMSAAGAVKSILNYLVRSKDFETLKNLKAIDGHDVTGIISKIFKPSNTIDLGEALDTEFQNFLKQAKHRYPDSKDETEAFMRYVHDELEKEGRIDRSQASDINQLEYKVNKLLASVEKLSMAKPPAPEL